jgi:hypothetical protein
MGNRDCTISNLFKKYRDDQLITRLEQYSIWTIPSVFPECRALMEHGNATIVHDYQSVGALLVNRLATKLASSLFPVGTSFFRIEINEDVKQVIKTQTGLSDADVNTRFIQYENDACRRLFYGASYAQLVQALRLLIITGEALLQRVDNRIKVYSLHNYVLRRNNVGDVLDIIIKERKLYSELTPELKKLVREHDDDASLELYTRVTKAVKQGVITWNVTQELDGVSLGKDYSTTYLDKLCPYIPVVWNHVNGDNYGRGYVEEYAGDFAKLSEESEALTTYELECLKLLYVSNPSGGLDLEHWASAHTGEVIAGDPNALQPLDAGSFQKIQQIAANLQQVEQRLGIAFMYTGNTRNGERVTAYEIEMNAREAESVLGGVYSQLSLGMHLPLAYLLLYEVDQSILTDFLSGTIEFNILTGLVALSKNSENQALLLAANQIATVVSVFAQMPEYSVTKIVDGILLANGIDPSTLKKSQEEIQQEARVQEQNYQQQQQQLMQQQNQLANTEAVQMAQGGGLY